MLPLNGWLVDALGKSLHLRCFSAFTLSSALCGLAWSNSLIVRILQGMSGGLMAPLTQMMTVCCRKACGARHGLRGCAQS